MAFMGSTWWLWLGLAIVFNGYVIYNQIKRMKGMATKGFDMDMDGAFKSFFSGMAPFVIAGSLGGLSGLLFLISLIVNIIDYVKA
ncbi:MAG: hypothetical protein NTX82_05550 [Candidatus Parcubacteria bacterium]|nr:hypothetical protein [Candidatus Parcubacteria bacterium]